MKFAILSLVFSLVLAVPFPQADLDLDTSECEKADLLERAAEASATVTGAVTGGSLAGIEAIDAQANLAQTRRVAVGRVLGSTGQVIPVGTVQVPVAAPANVQSAQAQQQQQQPNAPSAVRLNGGTLPGQQQQLPTTNAAQQDATSQRGRAVRTA